jgi:hypothetical protein
MTNGDTCGKKIIANKRILGMLGALAVVSDLLAGLNPDEVQLQTKNLPDDDFPDLFGHTQLLTTDGESLIDFGPGVDPLGFELGTNHWLPNASKGRYSQVIDIEGNLNKEGIIKKGVNLKRLKRISARLNTSPGYYNVALRSCSSVAARALSLSGAPMYGLHPYLLQLQAYLWSQGLRPWSFSYMLSIE